MVEYFLERVPVEHLIFAAIASFFLTMLVNHVLDVREKSKKIAKTFLHKGNDFNSVFQKCCLLFPDKIINFKGKVFTRGMMVKITTIHNKTFSGKLVGLNRDKVICLMTKTYIAADAMDNILDIASYEEGEDNREGKE